MHIYVIQLLNGLGVSKYQFSISWSRLFPQGAYDDNNPPNMDAVNHYNDVINDLIYRHITPEVTLYHFDMPQALEDNDGRIVVKL